jgi:hypothetical protein
MGQGAGGLGFKNSHIRIQKKGLIKKGIGDLGIEGFTKKNSQMRLFKA